MMQQQTPQVPAGLQALFVLQDPKVQQALNVLKQQAAPAAQGPQGQPTPTVSGQVLQSFSPPQPQMPPGMPPQGADMAGIAQNAATGANITGMQQQQAQEALMKQLMAQQQAKAQQPVMAAEGGIASLDIAGMEDYAEGGVVGFAEGGQPKSTIEGIWEWLKALDAESQKARWAARGQTLAPPAETTPVELTPLETPAEPPVKRPAQYEFESALTKELQRRAVQGASPRMDSGIAAPRQAATRQPAAPATIPGEDLYQQALRLADQYKGSDGRTAEQIERDRLAEYQRRGLPDLRRAAEERIRQTSEFDAESRKQTEAANKAAMLDAWKAGILQPGAQNLADVFSGAARGMIRERQTQSAAAIAQRAAERAQMILDNQIREALDKADKAAADGDITTAQAEKAKAQELHNKKLDVQREMMMNRAKEVLDYRKTMDAERLRQSGADRRDAAGRQLAPAVRILYENKLAAAAQAGQNVNDPVFKNTALTEAIREAANSQTGFEGRQNVQELKILQQSIERQLKDYAIQGPRRQELEVQLAEINKELGKMAGLSETPKPTVPPVGTVMQGYRFKGGDPSDRNNWEKV